MKKWDQYKFLKRCVFLKVYIKIEKTITKFDDIKIQKQKFNQH